MYFCRHLEIKKQKPMNTLLFLNNLGMGEIVIIALIVLLLFGGRKIPELMRGIGKGVRSFKEGINDVKEEINKPIEDDKNNEEKK
jgi:sec-independent protein translocase protein TatA